MTELSAVYPVPMKNTAVVSFSLARDQFVDLSIYDVRGARVRTIHTGSMSAGRHLESWDARDDAGRTVGGGIYFVRLNAGAYRGTWKTVVMP